jgi:hypothetical protein
MVFPSLTHSGGGTWAPPPDGVAPRQRSCRQGRPVTDGAGGRPSGSTTPSASTRAPSAQFENHPRDTLGTGWRTASSGEGQGDINCSSPEDPGDGASERESPKGAVDPAVCVGASNEYLQSEPGSSIRCSPDHSFAHGDADGPFVLPIKKKRGGVEAWRRRAARPPVSLWTR